MLFIFPYILQDPRSTNTKMSYKQRWHKIHSEASALAQNETDSENSVEDNSDTNVHNDNDRPSTSASGDQLSNTCSSGGDTDFMESESDLGSDFGYNEAPESSDSSDTDDEIQAPEEEVTFKEKLSSWCTRNNCTRACTNELLTMLREEGIAVPKDARTLLRTPRHVDTAEKCGGKYIYFGIANRIKELMTDHAEAFTESQDLPLKINVDGVPLFKSSTTQFWPILCSFDGFKPLIVALYYGEAKPTSPHEFLEDFLAEYSHLQAHGLHWEELIFRVTIQAFICDAPARAFLKCIKGHTGYFACERCVIRGYWKNNRIILHSANQCRSRTDEEFAVRQYTDHQTQASPLIVHGLQCVKSFCLDYMHLVCLGVVKRILYFLKQGPAVCKLSNQQICDISRNLQSFSGKLPSEFARQPRSLFEMERWKATEFRQFLLYTGPVALKKVVSESVYEHFLCLTVAISILLESDDEKRTAYLDYAQQLLDYFVDKSRDIYSELFIVYNVHNLKHLPEDVKNFKCSLNNVSAFPYENHLQTIKRLVRNAKNPIAQVTKRLREIEITGKYSSMIRKTETVQISTKRRNRCFQLSDEAYGFVIEKNENGTYLCDVIPQSRTENFFKKPCESKLINIAFIRSFVRAVRKIVTPDEIYRKVVCLPYERGYVLLPLLHGKETD